MISPTDATAPAKRYIIIRSANIITNATTPALAVLINESCPKLALTDLEDISVNLVGKLPELIKSTKLDTSSVVNVPWIITSLANPLETVATDKHLALVVPHVVLPLASTSVLKLSSSESKSNQITILLSSNPLMYFVFS